MVSAAGLINRADESRSVPLERVHVSAKLLDLAANVELRQHFANKEDVPIEALYRFPLSKQSALYGFEAIVDGVKLEGEIQEKEKAQDKYDDAIASGKGAYLVQRENTDEEEVFSMLVGNLPPQKEVEVRVQYVCEVNVESEQLRFILPTTISPLTALQLGAPLTTVPEAPPSEIKPPQDNNNNNSTTDNNKLSISIDIEMPSDIVAITSPSHPTIAVVMGTEKKTTAQVTFQQSTLLLDRDVVLFIKTAEPHKPRAWIEKFQLENPQEQQKQKQEEEEESHAIMLSYLPSFEKETPPCEIVFVVDRSGSMSGTRIAQARTALQFFLRSLPENCCFNIIGFGSSVDQLFPSAKPYSDDTLDTASEKVKHMDADLGGTDLHRPLQMVFSKAPAHGYRAVFCLTDGQVDNRDSVIQLVSKHSGCNRVFSFGIGSDVDRALVNGIAKSGKGEAEFVIESEGNISVKVLRHLARALHPFISEISLDWGLVGRHASITLKQSPKQLSTVMEGERITVYALVTGRLPQADPSNAQTTTTAPPAKKSLFSRLFGGSNTNESTKSACATLTVKWINRSAKEIVSQFQIPLVAQESSGVDQPLLTNGTTVHRLAARNLIKDLEKEGESRRDNIVSLSCRYSVASKFTSFVAVERAPRNPDAAATEQMVSRTVPILMSTKVPAKPEEPQLDLDECEEAKSALFSSSASLGAVRSSTFSASKKMKKKDSSSGFKAARRMMAKEDLCEMKCAAPAVYESLAAVDEEMACDLIRDCAPPPPPVPASIASFSFSAPPAPPMQPCAPPPPPSGGGPLLKPTTEKCADDDEDNSSGECEEKMEENLVARLSALRGDEREKDCKAKPQPQKQQQQQQPQQQKRTVSPKATLNALVMQQKASGSWKLDSAFAGLFNIQASVFKQEMPQQLQQQVQDAAKQEAIWATMLALAFLDGACKQFQGEWDMLAQKAQRWLEKELSSDSSVKDVCLNNAREMLRKLGVM